MNIVCTYLQGRSQPHGPGWARFPLSSFFLKFWSIWIIFPQNILIFFLILALQVGDSPTRKGPGYATAKKWHDKKTLRAAHLRTPHLPMWVPPPPPFDTAEILVASFQLQFQSIMNILAGNTGKQTSEIRSSLHGVSVTEWNIDWFGR